MAKLYVEDTEVVIKEKVINEDGSHEIGEKYYTQEVVEKTVYKSTIFSYDDISVLVTKQKRYGELYFKIVMFDDKKAMAWPLLVLSANLETKVKRLNDEMFLVVGESQKESLISQISFCKLKPSGKVDEITINFTKLKELKFIDDKGILISLEEKDAFTGDTLHVLSMYNVEGKLLKNFYEFYDTDKEKYTYELKDKNLRIIKLGEEKDVQN